MKKKNAITPKFNAGDTIYTIQRVFAEPAEMHYCPECNGRGKVEVEFPAYNTKTLATCPLCRDRRFGMDNSSIDQIEHNKYRKSYGIPTYGAVKGRIKRINIDQDVTCTSISYSVDSNHSTDICVYVEKDLYATLEDAQRAIEKKHRSEEERIDTYIGQKK